MNENAIKLGGIWFLAIVFIAIGLGYLGNTDRRFRTGYKYNIVPTPQQKIVGYIWLLLAGVLGIIVVSILFGNSELSWFFVFPGIWIFVLASYIYKENAEIQRERVRKIEYDKRVSKQEEEKRLNEEEKARNLAEEARKRLLDYEAARAEAVRNQQLLMERRIELNQFTFRIHCDECQYFTQEKKGRKCGLARRMYGMENMCRFARPGDESVDLEERFIARWGKWSYME